MPSKPASAAWRAAPEVLDDLADLVRLDRLRRFHVIGDPRRRPHRQPRPGRVVHAAVVRELQERERAVLADLFAHPLEVRHARRIPHGGVVVHLVRGGGVHLRLAGDHGAHSPTRVLGEVAAVALAVEAGLAVGAVRLGVHREVRAAHDAIARRPARGRAARTAADTSSRQTCTDRRVPRTPEGSVGLVGLGSPACRRRPLRGPS